jgi:hypothetical protein
MEDQLQVYRITAYTEWETLEVDAKCPDDEHAKDKARRYASLKHVGTNFPAVIFSHVVAVEPSGERDVGTWEYRLKGHGKPGFIWHEGSWEARPDPTDRLAIRHWLNEA